ncbi:MAG: acyl carrier protein [Alphaproteobacteria bacterium]|nr:acyl carrier protein [Alphaproteobacteria bacterium]
MARPNVSESEICDWCLNYIRQNVESPPSEIGPENTFSEMGLDSATSVYFVVELEEWLGMELEPEIVGDYPTIATLARHLVTREGKSSAG